MHISSQLATASPTQTSSAATSSLAASGPTFYEAFRAAATRGEPAGKVGAESGVPSDTSAAPDDARATGGTDAESSTLPVSGQSGPKPLPDVDLETSGQALVTAIYKLSGKTGPVAPASSVQTPAARTGESKSKKTPASDDSTGAVSLPTIAPASTPDTALLAANSIPPPPPAPANAIPLPPSAPANTSLLPLSTPVTDASASNETLASNADSSALPALAKDLVLPAQANQQTAGADVPADGQSPAVTAPVASAAVLPPMASEDLVADAGRLAAAAPPKAPNARPASIPNPNAKPAAETTAPSKVPVSSASNGLEAVPTPLTSLGNVQTPTPRQDAPPLTPTSAVGVDRSSAGEIRGKRKDAPTDGSAPDSDSTTNAPAPFAARLAEAQAPVQAGANGADAAAQAKTLDGSQPLASGIPLPPAQTNLPSAPAASAPAAAPSVPVASADPSAAPAALPSASSAQLIQSAGQTEMRLGMRSAEFGNISISTSVSHQAISAQISLDHSELGRALAVHLPAIDEKLGSAYGLHARVEVRDESAASRSAADSGSQGGASQEQTGEARGGQNRSWTAGSPVRAGSTGNIESTNLKASSPSSAAPAESSRLDIRI